VGTTEILAGGTDLLSLMKDHVSEPDLVVNIKEIKELGGISYSSSAGLRIGALATMQDLLDTRWCGRNTRQSRRRRKASRARRSGTWEPLEGTSASVPLLVLPQRFRSAGPGQGRQSSSRRREQVPRDSRQRGPAYFVNPSSLGPALIALGARVRVFGPRGA